MGIGNRYDKLEGNLVERDGSLMIDPLLKDGVKLSWLISPIVRNKELFYVISLE